MIDYQEKHDVKTHLVFRNVFTVVSAASELTKLTISAKMEGSRKCEAVLVVHCWMEGQPESNTECESSQNINPQLLK